MGIRPSSKPAISEPALEAELPMAGIPKLLIPQLWSAAMEDSEIAGNLEEELEMWLAL